MDNDHALLAETSEFVRVTLVLATHLQVTANANVDIPRVVIRSGDAQALTERYLYPAMAALLEHVRPDLRNMPGVA